MTRPEETEIEDLLAQVSQDWSSPSVAIRMH
jgi:hypothetical protein